MFAPFSGAMLYVLKFQMLVCNSFPSLSVQAALEHRRVCVEFERETEGKDWVPRFPAHFGHWMWHARQKQKHNLPQATGNFFCWLNNHHFSRQTFDVSIFLNVRIMPLFLSYDTVDWISLCFWIVALAIFHCFQMFPNRLIVKIISRVNNNENDHFFSGLFMMSNVTHQDK